MRKKSETKRSQTCIISQGTYISCNSHLQSPSSLRKKAVFDVISENKSRQESWLQNYFIFAIFQYIFIQNGIYMIQGFLGIFAVSVVFAIFALASYKRPFQRFHSSTLTISTQVAPKPVKTFEQTIFSSICLAFWNQFCKLLHGKPIFTRVRAVYARALGKFQKDYFTIF